MISENISTLGENPRKIIKIGANVDEICRKFVVLCNFLTKKFDDFLRLFFIWSGAKVCESCRT